MSTVGHYEIIKEVASTPVVQVCRVKTATKPDGSLVVKRCAPRQDGFIDCKPVIKSFLDSARTHQSVASKPGSHWAPIHEIGEDEDGGYYVADFYPGSAQKLVVGKVRLSATGLLTLIRAVVAGLVELRDASGRQHGNLKPTNVLIAGTDEVEDKDVFLADPADSANPAANDGGADDLFQLGQLVHQLVLHRPFRPVTGWPIEPSEAWSRLGYSGNRWRELCNHLLHPDPLVRPASLDDARREIERLGRRPVAFTIVRWAMVAVVLLAVGAGTWGYRRHRQIRADAAALASAYDGWFAEFATFAAENETIKGDPYLSTDLVPAVVEAKTTDSFRDTNIRRLINKPPSLFDGKGATELRSALGVIRRAETALSRWDYPLSLARRQAEFEKLGWTSAAGFLARRLDAAEPVAGNKSIGISLERLLAEKNDLDAALGEIDRIRAEIEGHRRAIADSSKGPDVPPVPGALAEFLAQAPAAYPDSIDSARSLRTGFLTHLVSLRDLGAAYASTLRPGWTAKYAIAPLTVSAPKLPTNPGIKDFQAWLEELPRYEVVALPKEEVGPLRQPLANIESKIAAIRKFARSPADEQHVDALDADRQAFVAQVDKAALKSFPRKDLEAEIARAKVLYGELRNYEEVVGNELARRSPEPPAVWLAAAEAWFDAEEPAIEDGWRQRFPRLVGADATTLAGDADRYLRLRAQAPEWAAALRKIPPVFPPPPSDPDNVFAAAIAGRRETALREAVRLWTDAQPPAVDEAQLARIQKEYSDSAQSIQRLADRCNAARDLIGSGAALDVKGPTGRTLPELAADLEPAATGTGPLATHVASVVQEIQRLVKEEEQLAALRGEVDSLVKKDELPEAIERCKAILSRKANDREAQRLLADLTAQIGQRKSDLIKRANAQLNEKQYDAAVDTLADLDRLQRDLPEARLLRELIDKARQSAMLQQGVALAMAEANAFVEQGQPEKALERLGNEQADEAKKLRLAIRTRMESAAHHANTGDQYFDQRNFRAALDAYRNATRGGNAHAMFRIGMLYQDGAPGVAPRPDEAMGWISRAAERHDADAMRHLARKSTGRDGNPWPEAIRAAATVKKDPQAQFHFAEMLEQGEGGMAKDRARAAQQYRAAAESGHAESMFRLAWMYETGDPLRQNTKLARDWYEKAGKAGHDGARRWLQDHSVASQAKRSTPPRGRSGDDWIRNSERQ